MGSKRMDVEREGKGGRRRTRFGVGRRGGEIWWWTEGTGDEPVLVVWVFGDERVDLKGWVRHAHRVGSVERVSRQRPREKAGKEVGAYIGDAFGEEASFDLLADRNGQGQDRGVVEEEMGEHVLMGQRKRGRGKTAVRMIYRAIYCLRGRTTNTGSIRR